MTIRSKLEVVYNHGYPSTCSYNLAGANARQRAMDAGMIGEMIWSHSPQVSMSTS